MIGRLAFLLAILGALACGRRPAPETPRTVILISVDALRADRLGVYGASDVETPAIDALGRESLLFEVAWTPVPLTLPAHASMLTGLEPPCHGVRANGLHRLAPRVPLVSEVFRRGGYRTGAFIGGFPLDRRFGLSRGFDHYDDELPRTPGGLGDPERRAREVVSLALAWLRKQPAGQPAFLFVHLYDPHAAYAAPPPFGDRYADRPYDGEVAYVDCAVAALRAGLSELGRWRDAVVVLVADHGESLGEHEERTHGLLLSEGVLRVPFLVRAPGLVPGRTRDPVSLVDVAPTLLARSGLPGLGVVDGMDVTAARDPGRDLYAETLGPYFDHGWSGLRALRRRGMKLIDGPGPEMYDLPGDPAESRDLWPSPAGAALRDALHRFAGRLRARALAPARPDAAAHEALASLGYAASSAEAPPDFGAGRPDPKSRVGVGRELDAVACLSPESSGDAVPRLLALARREPGSNLVRRRLAAARMSAGDYEAAIRDYREAGRLGYRGDDLAEALAEAHLRAGRARTDKGDLGRARELLAQSVRLVPGRADSHYAAGIVEDRAGRPEEAIQAFRRATKRDPRFTPAWYSLGMAQERLGCLAEALDSYRRFLALSHEASPERDHAAAYVSRSALPP